MKKIYLPVAVFFIYSFCSAQTSVNFTADKDNTIYSSFITNSNGAGQYFFVGKNSAANDNSVQRGLIHFDLSSIPSNAVITAATLNLTISKTAPSATGIQVHKLNANWGEGTSNASGNEASGAAATSGDATWTSSVHPGTAWTTAGGDFQAAASATVASIASGISEPTVIPISNQQIINDIQSWINSSSTNYGWLIKSNNEETSASIKRFFSANHSTSAYRPALSVTYTPGTVPINLTQFSATSKNGQVLLFWETASEINNKQFDIEHSSDAINFKQIGLVKGQNNSSSKKAYSFYHTPQQSGIHYYRLVQHDFNGAKHYTVVTSIRYNAVSTLQLYPNPAKNILYVKSNNSLQGALYTMAMADGKMAARGIITGPFIHIGQLQAGVYALTIQTKSGETIKSNFIKKP